MPKTSTLLLILCVLTLCWRYSHLDHHANRHAAVTSAETPVKTPVETPKKTIQPKNPHKILPLSQQIEDLIKLKPANMAIEELDISPKLIKISGQLTEIESNTAIQWLNAIKQHIPHIKHYRWQLKPDKQAYTQMDLLINLKPNTVTFNKLKKINTKNLPIHTQLHTQLSQFQALSPRSGLLIQEHSLNHVCQLTLLSSYAYALNLIKYIETHSSTYLCTRIQLKKRHLAPYVEMNLTCDSSC